MGRGTHSDVLGLPWLQLSDTHIIVVSFPSGLSAEVRLVNNEDFLGCAESAICNCACVVEVLPLVSRLKMQLVMLKSCSSDLIGCQVFATC